MVTEPYMPSPDEELGPLPEEFPDTAVYPAAPEYAALPEEFSDRVEPSEPEEGKSKSHRLMIMAVVLAAMTAAGASSAKEAEVPAVPMTPEIALVQEAEPADDPAALSDEELQE